MAKPRDAQLRNAFGFDPAESTHHFVVLVPRATTEKVSISEHFTWDKDRGSGPPTLNGRDGQVRVFLPQLKWEAIADEVRAQFNQRLKRAGRPSGNWQVGPNLVRRDLGKELVLLAWAIEDADPSLISTAVANWNGLEPEERWWLYTVTAARTGHALNGHNKGWRRAVRYAFTDNPTDTQADDLVRVPDYFHRAAGPLSGGPSWEDTGEE